MPIVKAGGAPAPASPPPPQVSPPPRTPPATVGGIRSATPQVTPPPPEPELPIAEGTEASTTALAAEGAGGGGIVTPRMRAQQQAGAGAGAPVAEAPAADLDSWTHSGDEAAAIAAAEAARREAEIAARRARGYWPRKFELIPPSADYPDRYQGDIIVLDAKMGPAFWLHVMKNPRTGRWDINEPCPKEWDNCPLDPPAGQHDSRYVALLTVLNINGFVRKTGPEAGQFVPVTQELLVVETAEQAFFHAQHRERGTLRGLQLTMTRTDRNTPRIGVPSNPRWHSEDDIKKFLGDNGMLRVKKTRPTTEHPTGEVIDPREDWMMHPFNYASFLHRPSAADLRARFQNGAPTPVGARSGADAGEWGGSRYEPGAAAAPGTGANGGWAGGVPLDADLDDEVPF